MRIEKWNFERGNTNFSAELENRMLAEEAQEFKDGMTMYFEATTVEERIEALVELIDAYCDYEFVATGTMFKYLGCSAPFDFTAIGSQKDYMLFILTTNLAMPHSLLQRALDLVVTANEAKGKEKVDGKIQKGAAWRDPKEDIMALVKDLLDA